MPRSPFLLPVLLACASLTVMAGATIAPGLPGLLAHFADHPDAEYLTRFIITVPGLAIAITAPIAGLLADRLGRRVLLQIGVALYIVAGSAGLWLDDLNMLLLSRLALGGAVGMIMVCSMALLTDHFQGPGWLAPWNQEDEELNFSGRSSQITLSAEEIAAAATQESTSMGWRHLPGVSGFGVTTSEPTVFPSDNTITAAWVGSGSVEWQHLTWEQNPTQFHIVNALADLPVLEERPAVVSHGATNLILLDDLPRVIS